MMAFSESKMTKYTSMEIRQYGVFDDDGILIGVKEDAPADFKEAYEADKKFRKKWEDAGVDV